MEISNEVIELTKKFQELNEQETIDFLKINGLFYLYPQTVEYQMDNDNSIAEEDIVWYQDLFDDEECSPEKRQQTIQKYLEKIKADFSPKEYYCVKKDDLLKKRLIYSGNCHSMTLIDSCNNDELMIFAKKGQEEKAVEGYKQRGEKGFDQIDVWNPYFSICKSILPQLLEEYMNTMHSYPEGIEFNEWKSILLRLIWFCDESINQYDELNSNNSEEYREFYVKSKDLFCKYFLDLWD